MSRAPAPGPFLVENGAWFLYLRGDCRYWVLAGTVEPGFGETREGVLEPNAEARLHDDLRYDEWPELAGVYAPEPPPADAGPPEVLTDLTNEIGCLICASLPDPKAAAVGAMFSAAWDWASALRQQGSPLTGPVRALAVEGSLAYSPYTGQVVPWTVGVPLSSLVVEASALWQGLGRLVDQPDAEVLRGWRNNQLAGMYHPADNGPFIPVSDNGGPFFALYVRDALPFEADNGVVPF
jgi:hypothetical protein